MKEKEPGISDSGQPGLVTGALIAAMLTASLIAVFYLAWKVAGLPFVPFDVFDWMTRILPGQVLVAGIGAMVMVIRALNLGPTAAAAKAAEQAMGIAGMFFTGIIAGTILFSICLPFFKTVPSTLQTVPSASVMSFVMGIILPLVIIIMRPSFIKTQSPMGWPLLSTMLPFCIVHSITAVLAFAQNSG
jgi:hypothetical protein